MRSESGKQPATLPGETAVKTFVIDATDHAKAYASIGAARKCREGPPFASEDAFASVSADWPMLRLVAIWNKLPGAQPVRKFTDRKTALRRIWTALQVAVARNHQDGARDFAAQPALWSHAQGAHGRNRVAGPQCAWTDQCPDIGKLGLRVESFKRQGERVYRTSKEAL